MLADLLRERAIAGPSAVAHRVHGGASLTFGGWDRRSEVMATALCAREVRAGDRVVLVFEGRRWPDLAVAYAAVHKAGAVAVVLSPVWPAPAAADVVADCDAVAVVAPRDLVAPGAAGAAWVAAPEDLEQGNESGAARPAPRPEDLAELVYAYGPLRPLASVARSHRDVASALDRAEAAGVGPAVLVHAFPAGTVAGTGALWFPLWAERRRAVTVASFEPDAFCAVVAQARATHVGMSPPLAAMLLASGALAGHDHSSVAEVVLADGRPRPRLRSDLAAAFPSASLVGAGPEPLTAEGGHERTDLTNGPANGPADPDVEAVLVAIWRRVLDREEVGAGDDFFGVGGDELGLVRVGLLIEDAFGVALPVSTLREATTVEVLAAAVQRRRTAVPEPDVSVAPVAFSQEGMLWHEQFAPGCQNLPPLARRYRGPLDVAALERALSEIVRRHQPLRTTFELREGRPVQVVAPPPARALPVRDLRALAADQQDAELDRALAEAARPLDLVNGPLFQATLYRLGEDDHVLVLRTHHSVFDDWSVGVFRRELSALYTAFLAGEDSPLEEPLLSFAEFSRGQRRRLAGVEGTRQLSYWKRRLDGAPLALQLPIGDPDRLTGAPQPSAAPVAVELPPELAAGVRALARPRRATLFMTLLAAFQVLLHRWTGQADLLLSSVVANRNRRELEDLIGCFSKKIVLRLAAPGDASFSKVLARAREVLLEALANQDLPFETVLQEALGTAVAEHGLVPYPVVMFQGVTPQPPEVALPGLTTSGFDTSATTRRLHFMAGEDGGPAQEEPVPWGAGLYSGTFLILSVVEVGDRLSLVARGAFHRPAVEELLASLRTLLADVVAHPDRRVSELAVPLPEGMQRERAGEDVVELRGFSLDLGRIQAALTGSPGVRELALAAHEVAGENRVVAYVVPDGEPPTLADLRVRLWRRAPGYAWPAAMVVVPDLPRDSQGRIDRTALPLPDALASAPGPAEEAALAAGWAAAVGVERVAPEERYWQSFSFLEAVAGLARAGLPIAPGQLARNRTLRTLAVDLATRDGGT